MLIFCVRTRFLIIFETCNCYFFYSLQLLSSVENIISRLWVIVPLPEINFGRNLR